MRNNSLYKKLKQIALDGGYTIAQVQGASKSQIKTLLGASNLKAAFVNNMKRVLITHLQDRDDEVDKVFLLNEIDGGAREAFCDRFPDFEIERDRKRDKPYITIWPKGKPEEAE